MSYHDDEDFWSTGPADGYSVCANCFDDPDLASHIDFSADSQECDFCGRRSRTRNIAAPLDGVVELMAEAINRDYERAVEALGWESAEGGYLGEHFDSRDLLVDYVGLRLPNDDDEQLLEILVDCFGDEPWCHRNPYGLRGDEYLKFSWEHFCEFIKHERRYFFLHEETADESSHEYLTPAQILEFVSKSAKEHSLIQIHPLGTLLYRARQQRAGEVLDLPYSFGPPPVELATKPNRMSPAGIVMFYGSDDIQTAVAEIDDDPKSGILVGTFRTTRGFSILDFTVLPRRLRFFETQSDTDSRDRYALSFLHDFVLSLAAKVEPGKREHIDYVPTQVVTEYFRTVFRREDGTPIDGIRYFSAQRDGGKSIVLFADQDDIVLRESHVQRLVATGKFERWQLMHEDAWLELVRKRVIRSRSD